MIEQVKASWGHRRQSGLAALYRLIDGGAIFISLLFWCRFFDHEPAAHWLTIGLLATALFIFFAESVELYRSWRIDTYSHMLGLTLFAWISVCTTLLLIGYFSKTGQIYSRLIVGSWFLSTAAVLAFWRYGFRLTLFYVRSNDHNTRTAAIVGITPNGLQLARNFAAEPHLGIRIRGFYSVPESENCQQQLLSTIPYKLLGDVSDALAAAKSGSVEQIYIALPMREEQKIEQILRALADTTANVHILPDLFFHKLLHSRWYQVGESHVLSVYDTPIVGINSWVKRLEDLVISVVLLIATLPLLLLIAICIKLTSKGPIIFKQLRYGLDGRPIEVWKFRTMNTLENGDTVVQARRNDPRVTPIGRLLRRASLDELPQLINVLQGQMSIVGPRPHAVAHNEEYRKLVSGYMLRHKVKPGITGWAQVNGWRGETDTLEKISKRVEHDLHYIRHWSIWLDLQIVIMTPFKGIAGENAY
ncbi:undecaprenyl-phosphate glucose phosphotransferase [Microbulbifer celer]|uniref:Undecaprenyl-phosphate glucose phosphotransferase n=1 Tax=Microbulbifer celer TaxID=435905 RepID=A0ABW3U4B7_9GAMM|nr:undecaprenyl-phosphate glucose phosphotransferase [Microbulbifer celer]UFN58081.1 undecaprenyl-phosphate glucose phosphotransferase [Microbulbifer celer]